MNNGYHIPCCPVTGNHHIPFLFLMSFNLLLSCRNSALLRVREHKILGPYVEGLTKLVVSSFEVCFTSSISPLTPRVKPWVIQSLQTFDSMNRTVKCDHLLESC